MNMKLRIGLASLLLTGASAFGVSQHPDLQVYERLGNPQLFQLRINYGFAEVAISASVLPSTLSMVDMLAKMNGTQPDKKSAACAVIGMLGQQVGDVYKFVKDPAGWATNDQKVAGEAIWKKVSEATSFCGLAGGKDQTPATTLDEAVSRISEVGSIAQSVK